MEPHANPLVLELEALKSEFSKTTDKLIKGIHRHDKIMSRSDKRQQQEYDQLQSKLEEVLKLQGQQKALMDSFIHLIAGAIDAKSKYTGGHCERVPQLAMLLAKAANDCNEGIFENFKLETEDEIRELSVAAWLHDCGKVTTPEYVVDKATKLETIYNRIHEVRTRFEVIYRDFQIAALNKLLQGEDKTEVETWLADELQKLQEDFRVVATANVGSEFMNKEDQEKVKIIGQREWIRYFDRSIGLAFEERQRLEPDIKTPGKEYLLSDKTSHIIKRDNFDYEAYEAMGFKMPVPEHLYNFGEIYNLTLRKGTLTKEERFKINDHIIMTIKMLETLPFPGNLKNVPSFAGMHHETMIGTGYPRKLTIDQMPIPARIMAIADVFEALTASDRPYKEAKKLSDAIKILSFMVKDQHIDSDLFKLFLSSGIYKEYADKFLKPDQIDPVDISKYIQA